MAKEFFKNLPDTSTPLNASRLNGLLNGNEAMGNIVVGDVRCKNLIPNNATSRTINGITITVNSDKSITLSGKSTSTSETLITLTSSMNLSLPSGSYTFSFGNTLPGGVRFEAWHEAATQFTYIGSGNSKGSVNITSDLSNFRTQLVISSGATVNTTIKYMLEEGTTANVYVPHKEFNDEKIIENAIERSFAKKLNFELRDSETKTINIENPCVYLYINSHIHYRCMLFITIYESTINVDTIFKNDAGAVPTITLSGNTLTITASKPSRGYLYKLNNIKSA